MERFSVEIQSKGALLMRKCMRCGHEMMENLSVTGDVHPEELRVSHHGVLGTLGNLKAAVCPFCGCAELYLDRLDKIREVNP